MTHFVAHFFYRAGGSVFAAKTEREAEGQGESNDETGEDGLDEDRGNAELVERRENGEDPDSPLGDGTREVGRARTGSASRTRNESAHHFRDDGAEDEDEGGDDYLRQEEQYHPLEEDGHRREAEDVKRGNEEHQDDEPHDECRKEAARIEVETRLFGSFVHAGAPQSLVYLENLDHLDDDAVQDRRDDPANKEYHDSRQDARQVHGHRIPEVVKRALDGIRTTREYHTKIT